MTFAQFSIPTLMGLVMLLPGCGAQRKQTARPPVISHKTVQYQETKDGISLVAQEMSSGDFQKTFGKNKDKLSKNGIVPVQITVTNNNPEPIRFSPSQKNIPFADYRKVRSTLQNSFLWPAGIACGIATLVATGLTGGLTIAFAAISAYWGGWIMLLPTCGVFIFGSGCSAVLVTKSYKNVQEVTRKIDVNYSVPVLPNQDVMAILFLDAAKLESSFDIHIHNASLTKTTFTIPVIKK
ncbi:hypothetical protein BH09DEP1_BH09DEP1_8290 [soil metagenome]